MQQQLDLIFDYKASIEERVKPVKVLKVIKGKKPNLALSKGREASSSYSGGGLSMTNSESGVIVEFLANQLETIVLDETGLKGLYDLELAWHNEKPDLIHQELRKLGLELIDAERKVKMLVITDK